MGTLFVSPTVGAEAGDHKINFGQFQAYSSVFVTCNCAWILTVPLAFPSAMPPHTCRVA